MNPLTNKRLVVRKIKQKVRLTPISCETCRYYDMEPDAIGNECWNCKTRLEMWEPKMTVTDRALEGLQNIHIKIEWS